MTRHVLLGTRKLAATSHRRSTIYSTKTMVTTATTMMSTYDENDEKWRRRRTTTTIIQAFFSTMPKDMNTAKSRPSLSGLAAFINLNVVKKLFQIIILKLLLVYETTLFIDGANGIEVFDKRGQ